MCRLGASEKVSAPMRLAKAREYARLTMTSAMAISSCGVGAKTAEGITLCSLIVLGRDGDMR